MLSYPLWLRELPECAGHGARRGKENTIKRLGLWGCVGVAVVAATGALGAGSDDAGRDKAEARWPFASLRLGADIASLSWRVIAADHTWEIVAEHDCDILGFKKIKAYADRETGRVYRYAGIKRDLGRHVGNKIYETGLCAYTGLCAMVALHYRVEGCEENKENVYPVRVDVMCSYQRGKCFKMSGQEIHVRLYRLSYYPTCNIAFSIEDAETIDKIRKKMMERLSHDRLEKCEFGTRCASMDVEEENHIVRPYAE